MVQKVRKVIVLKEETQQTRYRTSSQKSKFVILYEKTILSLSAPRESFILVHKSDISRHS